MYITLDGFNDFPEYPGSGDPPNDKESLISREMWIKNWDHTDTLLFDQETYGQWADFWPIAKRTQDEHPFYHQMSRFAERAQKVVFSGAPNDPSWANTRFIAGEVSTGVAQLRKESGKNMALVAPKLAQQFMRLGLIDDYLFAFFPVILGKGHRLFGDMEKQQTLRLVDLKQSEHGEVFLHYETVHQ
jgi:dihydrofolate reductase